MNSTELGVYITPRARILKSARATEASLRMRVDRILQDNPL